MIKENVNKILEMEIEDNEKLKLLENLQSSVKFTFSRNDDFKYLIAKIKQLKEKDDKK